MGINGAWELRLWLNAESYWSFDVFGFGERIEVELVCLFHNEGDRTHIWIGCARMFDRKENESHSFIQSSNNQISIRIAKQKMPGVNNIYWQKPQFYPALFKFDIISKQSTPIPCIEKFRHNYPPFRHNQSISHTASVLSIKDCALFQNPIIYCLRNLVETEYMKARRVIIPIVPKH